MTEFVNTVLIPVGGEALPFVAFLVLVVAGERVLARWGKYIYNENWRKWL